MADFESFSGFNTTDQMDEQAFEQFKERMKANAAHVQSIKISEQKQKKHEDKLAKILLKFIQKHQNSEIVLLISRALEDNIPAFFILSIILLDNEEVQKEVGVEFKLSTEQEKIESAKLSAGHSELIIFDPNNSHVLPLKVRITIDLWARNIFESCTPFPHKVVKNAYDLEGKIKSSLLKLTMAIIRQYLESNQIENETEKLLEFSFLLIRGILNKLQNQIANQKEIKGEVSNP